MKTIIENGQIKVKSEYSKDFIKGAKMIQGKWNSPYWCFPEENADEVRELLLDVYGECGELSEGNEAVVTVELDLDEYTDVSDCVRIGSMTVASRPGRDYMVKLNDNTMCIKGGFPESGGSVKNPRVCPEDGTVLRVKNVPVKLYERIKDMAGVSLVNVDRTKLLEERERLIARLAEIDDLLAV